MVAELILFLFGYLIIIGLFLHTVVSVVTWVWVHQHSNWYQSFGLFLTTISQSLIWVSALNFSISSGKKAIIASMYGHLLILKSLCIPDSQKIENTFNIKVKLCYRLSETNTLLGTGTEKLSSCKKIPGRLACFILPDHFCFSCSCHLQVELFVLLLTDWTLVSAVYILLPPLCLQCPAQLPLPASGHVEQTDQVASL